MSEGARDSPALRELVFPLSLPFRRVPRTLYIIKWSELFIVYVTRSIPSSNSVLALFLLFIAHFL